MSFKMHWTILVPYMVTRGTVYAPVFCHKPWSMEMRFCPEEWGDLGKSSRVRGACTAIAPRAGLGGLCLSSCKILPPALQDRLGSALGGWLRTGISEGSCNLQKVSLPVGLPGSCTHLWTGRPVSFPPLATQAGRELQLPGHTESGSPCCQGHSDMCCQSFIAAQHKGYRVFCWETWVWVLAVLCQVCR